MHTNPGGHYENDKQSDPRGHGEQFCGKQYPNWHAVLGGHKLLI